MVHPLQTEAVDYTVARTESLMALCLLTTWYCAIRGWTLAAIAACAAGMACKETMALAPPAVRRATTLARNGRVADALGEFRRAVDLLPDDANAHRNLATAAREPEPREPREP